MTEGYTVTEQVVPADTLSAGVSELFGGAKEVYAAAAGFGPRPLDIHPLLNNYYFVCAILLLFISFCYLIYNYRQSVGELFSEGLKDKILNEQSLVFRRFLTYGLFMSLLLSALILIKTMDISGIGAGFDNDIPWWTYVLIVPVLFLVHGLYVVYRRSVSGLIGRITLNGNFFGQYGLLSRISLLGAAFFIAPLFFLLVLGKDADNNLFVWIIATVAVVMYLLYLGRSLRFFRQKNVSIFHWFLYLCAVEFLPLSFVLVTAVRYSS